MARSRRTRHGFNIAGVVYFTPRPVRLGLPDLALYVYPTYHPPVKGRPARNRARAAAVARARRARRELFGSPW